VERCESGSQRERCGIVSEADPQSPRATERNKLHAPDGVLNLLEYVARLGQKLGARRCKPGKPMSFPSKQTGAHLFFEACYLFGDRRPCDLESIGRATEIQLLGNDDEIPEVPKLNISMTNIIRQAGAAPRSRFS